MKIIFGINPNGTIGFMAGLTDDFFESIKSDIGKRGARIAVVEAEQYLVD